LATPPGILQDPLETQSVGLGSASAKLASAAAIDGARAQSAGLVSLNGDPDVASPTAKISVKEEPDEIETILAKKVSSN
jgi:hypothetical protein